MSGLESKRRNGMIALSGGVGGAKLALGLAHVLDPDQLLIVANTGDDFVHLGFPISPDIDTLVYTLAGLNDPDRGWGRRDETWAFMDALATLGGDTWFRLGDRDLAVHVERARRFRAGERLSAITTAISRRFGVRHEIVPMSDDPVRTTVLTHDRELEFQDYFVREQCRPEVRGFRYDGAAKARAHPRFLTDLANKDCRGVLICPSNPFVSIDPILAISGVRKAINSSTAPVIAVSPIVGGTALKGPTGKMMSDLGLAVSPVSIAWHYRDIVDALLIDECDRVHQPAIEDLGVKAMVAPIVMNALDDKIMLARRICEIVNELSDSSFVLNRAS